MNADIATVTLDIQDLTAVLTVQELRGAEGMNELYAFDLLVSALGPAIDPDEVVGRSAVLVLGQGERRRHVHGIVSAFAQAESKDHYQATIVPRAWLLSQGEQYRILQGLTVPQIVERVLGEAGLDGRSFRISLQGSHGARDLCVQYQESDWAFLSRLLESEGIFFFFEHTEAGSTLVFADHPGVLEFLSPHAEIPYLPASALEGGERVLTFRFASRIRPGKVSVLDVPFDTPNRRNQDTAQGGPHPEIAVFAYPSSESAKSRLDALQMSRSTATGTARSVGLVPGSLFKLVGHPRPGADGGYLVTHVEHSMLGDEAGEAAGAYVATFACVAEGTPYRPPARTPKPKITGPQAARVVGPEGTEIHVDGDDSATIEGNRTATIEGSRTDRISGNAIREVSGNAGTLVGGNELHEVSGNRSVSVAGNLQEIVDGSTFASHGALSVAVSGDTAMKGTGEVKIESEQAMKIGGPKVYMSGDSTIYLRAYDKITLEVKNASTDDDAEGAKIEITQDGIYLTHGSTRKKLTGDKIHLNC
jgi:type VI secretion system VgrG family protein